MSSRISTKLLVVFLLTIVILFALLAVGITISSREAYREQAVQSISQSYAGTQTVVAPVLMQHVLEDVSSETFDAKGVARTQHDTKPVDTFVMPRTLRISGIMIPSERHHGLYSVTVYELHARFDEDFDVPPVKPGADTSLRFALSDVRGLLSLPVIEVDGSPAALTQSVAAGSEEGGQRSVLVAPLPPLPKQVHVRMDIALGGTQQLAFAPIAGLTHVELSSSWRSPLFAGRFLPRTRQVNGQGFKAEWDIPGLATAAPQQATHGLTGAIETLDVTLIQPSDPYKLSDRATKYGVLFVALTFGGFFVFEVMKQLPIHPVQYLLVGFALALFFLLLISFSEHVRFGLAYLISSVACVGLMGFYLSYVLGSVRRSGIFICLISCLFATIYGLLLSEDNALLLGALMLFAVLAGAMAITRRVDWYGLSGAAPAVALPARISNQPPA